MLKTSDNGVDWFAVDNGRIFKGNSDRTTKVKHEIHKKPTARILRLCPLKWNEHISMRWEAYICTEI